MRKIYDEYFHIPEQGEGSMREKVFFARLIVSVAFIVLCMFAMGYNAYAYFTSNIESTSNVLKATTYSFDWNEQSIKLVSENGSAVADANVEGKFKLEAGTYDVTLKKEGNATTGYGKINILKETEEASEIVKSFYTQQIGVVDAEGNKVESRTIRISVTKTTMIHIVACWGTYSNPEENKAFDENLKAVSVGADLADAMLADKTTTSEQNVAASQPATASEGTDSKQTESQTSTSTPANTQQSGSMGNEEKDESEESGSDSNSADKTKESTDSGTTTTAETNTSE